MDSLFQSSQLRDAVPRQDRRRRSRAFAYLLAFVGAAMLSLILFYGVIGTLFALDRLPPPPVSGTWCIDNRFAWFKKTPNWKEGSLIAVGSSTTWRNLDFSAVAPDLADMVVVNAAPCFLTFNQTRYLTEYLLKRAAAPRTIMTVVAPRDFENCSQNRTDFFDPAIADDYIERDGYAWWLYFRNFRVGDTLTYAIYARERRLQMENDAYGSGPLITSLPDAGRPFRPEPNCYSELNKLATILDAKGIQFIVVTFPVMPGWASHHDQTGTTRMQFKFAIEAALKSTKAILVDGMAGWHPPDSAFTDPVHLQWPETAAFTRFVWSTARQNGADLPALKGGRAVEIKDDNSSNGFGRDGARAQPARLRDGFANIKVFLSQRPEVRRSSSEVVITSPLLDAINQNTPGFSEGYPAGVPRAYSWCSGSDKPPGHGSPPSDFTAVTGWGQIYPMAGAPDYSNPDAAVEIANAKTYVHIASTQQWMLVQKHSSNSFAGAHFVSDFSPRPGRPLKLALNADGSVAIGVPPAGYNSHFWMRTRGVFAPGTVDGVYVQMDMRVSDPRLRLVANIGADWWRNTTARFEHGFANNPGAGMSNWVELSTEWSTLRFYSPSTERLLANLPPALRKHSLRSNKTVTRRLPISSPCVPGLHRS